MNMDSKNTKIDMVYLWCDGSDPDFKARKNKYLGTKEIVVDDDAKGEKRFFDNEELKYSLRSLEMYAPWINHVYIVTDRQVPKWLNVNCERVTIVDHAEIMPQEYIPCFCSSTIEYFLPHIPNLEEKFLYGNDDMFFGAKVTPEDFFVGTKPIIRLKKTSARHLRKNINSSVGYAFDQRIVNSLKLLEAKYGKLEYYVLHHNIDAYTKSGFLEVLQKYEAYLKPTFTNRFRNNNDFQRVLVNLDYVYSGKGVQRFIKISRMQKMLSYFAPLNVESYDGMDDNDKYQDEIKRFRPKLFCINSGTDCSIEKKEKTRVFMERLFPKPSQFEISRAWV